MEEVFDKKLKLTLFRYNNLISRIEISNKWKKVIITVATIIEFLICLSIILTSVFILFVKKIIWIEV